MSEANEVTTTSKHDYGIGFDRIVSVDAEDDEEAFMRALTKIRNEINEEGDLESALHKILQPTVVDVTSKAAAGEGYE